MCKNAYEKYIERSEKKMILCSLCDMDKTDDINKLCICQRFCSDKDKYIPYHQKEGCKKYED